MGIGWCASTFSLETRLAEPALLSMSFLSPVLGSFMRSLVYLEIIPSSPGRVMGFLMEALLLEMCTEERICVLMYWGKVTKKLDRAFFRRCRCVCQNPEVKAQPWSNAGTQQWNTIIWRQKCQSLSQIAYIYFYFQTKWPRYLNLYLEDPYCKYPSCTVWI